MNSFLIPFSVFEYLFYNNLFLEFRFVPLPIANNYSIRFSKLIFDSLTDTINYPSLVFHCVLICLNSADRLYVFICGKLMAKIPNFSNHLRWRFLHGKTVRVGADLFSKTVLGNTARSICVLSSSRAERAREF
jgi:hypothetical protein